MASRPNADAHPLSPGHAEFRLLPPATREALVAIGTPRVWRDGQMLLRIGEAGSGVFLVRSGRVRLRVLNPDGHELILGWFRAGTLGQLVSALAEVASPCDIVADGRCEVLHIARDKLTELLARDAAAALAIARLLSVRLGLVLDMLRLQSLESLADRVWATLLRLARWTPVGRSTGAPRQRVGELVITQADLARAVGASRYRVGLVLQRLADDGHVVLQRGRITVFAPR